MNMRLNKTWTKTVSTFVTMVSHLICDHKEATQGIHTDDYYVKKLNATFFKHKDMAAHIQTMETQDAMLLQHFGTTVAPRTYDDHLHKPSNYTTLLDNQYAKSQAQQQNTNSTNVSSRSNNSNGQQSGRGNGNQGRGRGNGGGCDNGGRGRGQGNGGRGSGGHGNNNNFIDQDTWNNMSWDNHQAIIKA